MTENKSVFELLNAIDVNDKTEKKKNLTYLSWAWAWAEVKKLFPDADYKIKRFGEEQLPYQHDPLLGYMVYTEVTINGLTHEMWLPVMDAANKAMKDKPYTYKTRNGEKICEAASMFDVNKTIMRCLTKNLAMHGLGLYIYAGEDLPEDKIIEMTQKQKEEQEKAIMEIENLKQEVLAFSEDQDEEKLNRYISNRLGFYAIEEVYKNAPQQCMNLLKELKKHYTEASV
ncbi:DUF1071 domain-containing protein [Ignavigranum ruoffiae]|uniref:Sak single strand annealing protein n=1 Tax=Ignavigranum ruoffiae TaxID=89093 RepID=UPI002357108B|nr:DUF1071 domain-containing protein [Ignavigranum ruoffiae]